MYAFRVGVRVCECECECECEGEYASASIGLDNSPRVLRSDHVAYTERMRRHDLLPLQGPGRMGRTTRLVPNRRMRVVMEKMASIVAVIDAGFASRYRHLTS